MNQNINIRELRNHGGQVMARVARGEVLTVTHSGTPVARLSPLAPTALSAATLLARWRELPSLEPSALKADIDSVLDAQL